MKSAKCNILALILLFIWTVPVCVAADEVSSSLEQKRNKLIGYMLGKQLPSLHYSDKEMDDDLSKAAFDLYLKQLDFQKRFLLRQDVEQLRAYTYRIDDDLVRGTIGLPETGYTIISERIGQVKQMVGELLSSELDPNLAETMESDPEKLEFADDLAGLRERWRLLLKMQIVTRYLELEEQEKKQGTEREPQQLWVDARERVQKRFDNFFHRLEQETLQDHYDRYFNSIARAFDPHTNYMAPDRKEDFDIHMRGSLEGIGALLREEDGYIKVVRIVPGSASARQGQLKAEDIIQAVAESDQEPVEITDMRLRDAVRLIRGPKGSEVRLTVVKPDGVKVVIPIIRDVVQIEDAFVKTTVIEADGHRFGYLSIPSFYRDFEKNGGQDPGRNSTDDTRRALVELNGQGVEGIILDLRDNGGGSLVDAVDIAGLFIDSGPVVQVKNSYGLKRILEDDDANLVYGGPLIVLVNQFSASASEIVAAALQDYRRAVIVGGKHTHGKGTVQTIIDLNENIPLLHLNLYDDLGALKVTIQKFYRVNGGSTQYRGVEPDIVLPNLFQYLDLGEQYLDYSLPWDQEDPAPFKSYTEKIPHLDEVLARSRKRIAESPTLQKIEAESRRSAERSKQTLVTVDVASMRVRLEQERESREEVTGLPGVDQDENTLDTTVPEQKAEEAVDRDAWKKVIGTDPYIVESEMILRDLTMLGFH